MTALRDDVDVEVGDNVVRVDETLYFTGTECKYCRDNSRFVVVVDDDRVGPHFPVCEQHKEKLEQSDKDVTPYELSENE